jgi:hypothetical protein
MRIHALPALCHLILATAGWAPAATVQFGGLTDGLNDGSHYISPFRLTIDGKAYLAMCYDLTHTVVPGDLWQANLLTARQLDRAYFAGEADAEGRYLQVIWLYAELMKTASASDRAGIQHAAWGLFASSAPTAGAGAWTAAAGAARLAGFPGIDFSTFRVVNSIPGGPVKQGFIVGGFAAAAEVPEPGTWQCCGIALLAAGISRLRRRRT